MDPEILAAAEKKVRLEARNEGIFAGATSALASGVIGGKLLKLNKYQALASAIITGGLAGYYFTQGFTSSALARLSDEKERREASGLVDRA